MTTALLIAMLCAGLAPTQDVTTTLSSLDLSQVVQSYGTPRKDKSVDQHPLSVGGVTYAQGIGSHAVSSFSVRLDGKCRRFTALVGVDDEQKGQGTVEFQVFVDKNLVWKSGVMRGGQAAKPIDVSLKGAKLLRLVATDGGDDINSDHADWLNPVIVSAAGYVPKAHRMPAAIGIKVAHGIPAQTMIHGARIVGCTPGHDFLFRIPATGKGTLHFSAKGLPEGITLDAKTGVVSGVVKAAGTYTVNVTVKGAKGTAKRDIKVVAGEHKLALTPPMGWNSWNVWATSVTAERVRAAAQTMVDSGLANFGYQYVNIDDAWEAGRDANGEILTNEKFGDMRALANEVHAMGLKLGIYSSPGPKTCAGYEGSYQHESQDAKTYAKWGIDYLKYDWCSYTGVAGGETLYHMQKPYALMREALDACGRDIVYSLCQYGMGDVWKWGKEVGGNCWRTTGDITDTWGSMSSIGFAEVERAKYIKPGGWNDPDMMVVGKLGWSDNPRPCRLTPNEQVTHLTIWSMVAAPILLGCDMTKLDDFTKDLLMNHDVIEVNQDPAGKPPVKAWTKGTLEVWTRPLWDGTTAVALFNRDTEPEQLKVSWKELGVKPGQKVRDCWQRKDLGVMDGGISRNVPGHGALLFRVGEVKP